MYYVCAGGSLCGEGVTCFWKRPPNLVLFKWEGFTRFQLIGVCVKNSLFVTKTSFWNSVSISQPVSFTPPSLTTKPQHTSPCWITCSMNLLILPYFYALVKSRIFSECRCVYVPLISMLKHTIALFLSEHFKPTRFEQRNQHCTVFRHLGFVFVAAQKCCAADGGYRETAEDKWADGWIYGYRETDAGSH